MLSKIFSLFMEPLFLNINYFYIFRLEDIFVLFLMRNILDFSACEALKKTAERSLTTSF